jgi:hypothetical protein
MSAENIMDYPKRALIEVSGIGVDHQYLEGKQQGSDQDDRDVTGCLPDLKEQPALLGESRSVYGSWRYITRFSGVV